MAAVQGPTGRRRRRRCSLSKLLLRPPPPAEPPADPGSQGSRQEQWPGAPGEQGARVNSLAGWLARPCGCAQVEGSGCTCAMCYTADASEMRSRHENCLLGQAQKCSSSVQLSWLAPLTRIVQHGLIASPPRGERCPSLAPSLSASLPRPPLCSRAASLSHAVACWPPPAPAADSAQQQLAPAAAAVPRCDRRRAAWRSC